MTHPKLPYISLRECTASNAQNMVFVYKKYCNATKLLNIVHGRLCSIEKLLNRLYPLLFMLISKQIILR